MAISSLTSLGATTFKGGRGLTGSNATSLRGRLNTVITKVNEVITAMNAGTLDVLDVGSGTGLYYGSGDSWFSVDGTNPPTCSLLRMQDQSDGSFKIGTLTSGTLAWA
jgi:hypothetical protein